MFMYTSGSYVHPSLKPQNNMETKPFYLSKRFWGFVATIIGKYAPSVIPNLTPIWNVIEHAGEIIFGAGVVTAKKPLGLR